MSRPPHRAPDWRGYLWCGAAGAGSVASFAPFSCWYLLPLLLAILFRTWLLVPERRAGTGFAYGLGLFTVGVHWIYISLHDHGGMPAPIAGLALLGFAAFCALIPAVAGALSRRLPPASPARTALLTLPAAWTLLEWSRTWFCTGFPWLAAGYSQVPGPLAIWLPWGGVYTASLLVAMLAGALALISLPAPSAADGGGPSDPQARLRARWQALGTGVMLAGLTLLARLPAFTQPIGHPVRFALIQGNIAQDEKFDPVHLAEGLHRYLTLAQASSARLIVLPESAVPLLHDDVSPDYLDALRAIGQRNGGDLLVGMFDEPRPGEIHNSMFSLGQARQQVYRKHHLVPFGEFIPLGGLVAPIMNALLAMPIGSQAAGPLGQGTMAVAGQQVAMDICYEDAFGEEIITALPAATLLVNVSNDAWFGMAVGPEQHLQMAQARSLETGREMLRTTNTGVTALIGANGVVLQRAPKGEVAVLEGLVQGRSGTTPFVRMGNHGVVVLCLLLLWQGSSRRRRPSHWRKRWLWLWPWRRRSP